MDDFSDENKLTLEKVINGLHQSIGEILTRIGEDLCSIPDDVDKYMHGRGNDFGDFIAIRVRRTEVMGYRDLVERADPLYRRAEEIWQEKGFRHSGSLLTAREHQECGSSGYGKFMVMPDTVVRIADQTLQLLGEMEQMSLEEIRRARILYGMPTIDDTGTATGEIVPIKDSYHFLTAERKIEVRRLEQAVISGLREIVNDAVTRYVAELTEYGRLVKRLAKGNLTTSVVYAHLNQLKIDGVFIVDLRKVADNAKKLSYQEGRRDDILTPMELMILGRTFDESYAANPYTPLGVQKKELSVKEANKLRTEEIFFDSETDLFTPYLMPFAFSLEPLNLTGRTERGPLVLHRETKKPLDLEAVAFYKDRIRRPITFARPIDWYFKSAA